jgi:hypothetical protein
LRYLRANSFSVEKTISHILTNLSWREEQGVIHLLASRPESILGVNSMSEITGIFPHWHSGYDRFGRPVIYKQYGNFDVSRLLKVTTLDALMKYHIWEQEACMDMCYRRSLKCGIIAETVTVVIDVKGMVLSQVTSDFLTLVKGIAKIDQSQYPETLGRFFIINTPSVFPLVWRGVKMFLDPGVSSKIEIFGCKESEWKRRLIEFIGEENLPQNYGGVLEPLSPSKHPYEEILSIREFEGLLVAPTTIATDGVNVDVNMPSEMSPEDGKDKEVTYIKFKSSTVVERKELSAIYRGWNQEITFLNHVLNPSVSYMRTTGSGSVRPATAKLQVRFYLV